MITGEPWTAAQDDFLCANSKLKSDELAKQVSLIGPERTLGAVRDRFRRLRKIGALAHTNIIKGWSEAELAIVKALYTRADDREIVAALKRSGFTRTREGVTRCRQRHGLVRPIDPEEKETVKGWHSATGNAEQRDRQFVRLVIAEALRLGLYRREAA